MGRRLGDDRVRCRSVRSRKKAGPWMITSHLPPDRANNLTTPSIFNQQDAAFSPDSRWIAYSSNESGADEVYVQALDRKSTRLNSSHSQTSYAVFCLKKKKKRKQQN